jgi:hypothetical protein
VPLASISAHGLRNGIVLGDVRNKTGALLVKSVRPRAQAVPSRVTLWPDALNPHRVGVGYPTGACPGDPCEDPWEADRPG